MIRRRRIYVSLLAVLGVAQCYHGEAAFIRSGFATLEKDLMALTRRVTAHHILLPPNADAVAIALKQQIRNQCTTTAIELKDPTTAPAENQYRFVVDVFAEAAKKYSCDETTKDRGGLIGELVPQGYCRSPELDRACFEVRLGVVEGPIETPSGLHLLLISERTNCPKLDGDATKLVPVADSGFGTLVPSEQVGRVDVSKFVMDQIIFWIVACLAGGVLAELAAMVGSVNSTP